MESIVDISLYPNPAVNTVRVDYPGNRGDRLEVYHISGALVHTQSVDRPGEQEIDLRAFDSGYYLVKVNTPEGHGIRKLVVNK